VYRFGPAANGMVSALRAATEIGFSLSFPGILLIESNHF
jgi:hypothetical protein